MVDTDLIKRALVGRHHTAETKTAIAYADGDQIEDVRSELHKRFPRSQIGGRVGSEIQPVVVPIAPRFVDEQATAYNRAVGRELVGDDGEVVPDATEALTRALGEACYDESMHELDRVVINVKACGHWPHDKDNKLGVELVFPCDAYPVPKEGPGFRASKQDDYEAMVVETGSATANRSFVLTTATHNTYFEGTGPTSPAQGTMVTVPNPDGLQPITWWHRRLPTSKLLPDSASAIMLGNRELNVAFSVLFDTIRFQSYAVPVFGLLNPSDPKAKRAHGVRFPLVLGPGETADMLSAATTFTEQVEVLRSFVSFLAMGERLSPNDIALDGRGASAASGFAKLVDSLPKLEAREERLRRLTAMEEQYAWPRLARILIRLNKLPQGAEQLRLRVRFEAIRYPEMADETSKRFETAIKYGHSTRAKLLAEQRRISVQAAEIEVAENMAKNSADAPPPVAEPTGAFGLPGRPSSVHGRLIGRAKGEGPGEPPAPKPAKDAA